MGWLSSWERRRFSRQVGRSIVYDILLDEHIGLLTGGVLLAIAAIWGWREWRLSRRIERTTGTVVGRGTNIDVLSRRHKLKACAIIEFLTPDGESHRFLGPATESPPPEGETVPVVYDSAKPTRAWVGEGQRHWWVPLALLAIGLALIVRGHFAFVRLRARDTTGPL